jgi:hypothetical protein
MTKQKRAVTLNAELDAAIGILAIRHKMSYSGFVESRLMEHKEIAKEIQRQRELPEEPPAMLRGDIRETLKHSPHDIKKINEIAAE